MSQSFECGDTGALVAYVYDECEPDERDAIALHLTRCHTCTTEIDALGSTRQQLSAWTPPLTALGFQIPIPAAEAPAPWWKAPLPAWAQAAAAVLIFGAGLSVGLTRGQAAVAPAGAGGPVAARGVEAASRAELIQLEQRLRNEMGQFRTTTVPATVAAARPATSDAAIMQKVQALVEQSEERQRREFTLRSVEMARDFETQRRVDLASVRETVGQLQGVTGAEIRQQRQAIDQLLVTVSQQGR